MRKILIDAIWFEKGDRVRTPIGRGTVVLDTLDNDSIHLDYQKYRWAGVMVQHDSGCEENPENLVIEMIRDSVIPLLE